MIDVNHFSPAWHLQDAMQNAKETHIKDVRIERVKRRERLENTY
jgi:hypothetical protein